MTTTHTLNVAHSRWHNEDDPDFDLKLTCSDPAACPGWTECIGDHSAATDEDVDNGIDGDEVVLHGVAHGYHYGYGWTVPFKGCPVVENDWVDEARDIARDKGPGSYRVDAEWDDECMTITLAEDQS